MTCYAGIDLHATNSILVVLDQQDQVLYQKRLRNELPVIIAALEPFRSTLAGVAVESTYKGYWLVDGMMDAGDGVHLAHAPALLQYRGLKHADDLHDARWLAHLLRLGCSPPAAFSRKRHASSALCSASAATGCGGRRWSCSACNASSRGWPGSG